MQIVVYFFAASFVFMAAALMVTYKRTRHYGVFLLALAYAVSAVLAVVLVHWWPLVAGFVLVWVLRFLGLDPDVRKNAGEESVKE
jgi:uncharacterized membrane protein HdeD (DUF308 family)